MAFRDVRCALPCTPECRLIPLLPSGLEGKAADVPLLGLAALAALVELGCLARLARVHHLADVPLLGLTALAAGVNLALADGRDEGFAFGGGLDGESRAVRSRTRPGEVRLLVDVLACPVVVNATKAGNATLALLLGVVTFGKVAIVCDTILVEAETTSGST